MKIVSGLGDRNEKKNLITLRDSAREWEKECIEAIEYLRPCGDCYVDIEKFDITYVCTKPHLIVWAQCGEFPYWPGKVKSIEKGKLPVRIDFFGDVSTAPVRYSNCYLYSKEDPNVYITDQYKENVKIAMEVSQ